MKVKVPATSSSVTTSGHVQPLVDVVFDRPELVHDPFVGPALERAAEIDADQLAEHRGVGALGIVVRQVAIARKPR